MQHLPLPFPGPAAGARLLVLIAPLDGQRWAAAGPGVGAAPATPSAAIHRRAGTAPALSATR
jgi:hypothetical protein